MFAGSARFESGIIYGHDAVTRCEVLDNSGIVVRTLDIIAGNVSVDANRKTRRQCSLTLQDASGDLVPDEITDILQPYSGFYLRLFRGMKFKDGTTEMFPLGSFAPYSPKIVDAEDTLEIQVDGYDRSKLISRTRWTQPYVIESGTNTGLAIQQLLENRMPGLRYNIEPTGASVPLTVLGTEADNDPWADAQKLANSDGMEVFFDAQDVVVVRRIPDPESDPIVRTFEDNEVCTVMEFRREVDASKMYTGVIVYSEGTEVEAPIRVEVWSPDTTLRIPYFFPTSLIKSEAQALLTGQSLLRRVGKAEYGVEMTTIPDPRQEVGDVVRVIRARSRLNDVFVLDIMNIPLDSVSSMSLTTAKRRGP